MVTTRVDRREHDPGETMRLPPCHVLVTRAGKVKELLGYLYRPASVVKKDDIVDPASEGEDICLGDKLGPPGNITESRLDGETIKNPGTMEEMV